MCWEIVAPLCRQRCQRSTTLLWPQLLSEWQTAWQSQVVEIYHGDPSNKWHRAPPGRLGRRTSDKQLFVLFHVLPSSPLLFSPLHVHFCNWAARSVCTLIVFSIQIGCLRWVPLIKLSFNQVSRCKTVTLLLFDSWLLTTFAGSHLSRFESLTGRKVSMLLLYGFAQWYTWTPTHIFTYLKQKEQLKKTINKSNLCILTTRFLPFVALALRQVWGFS